MCFRKVLSCCKSNILIIINGCALENHVIEKASLIFRRALLSNILCRDLQDCWIFIYTEL